MKFSIYYADFQFIGISNEVYVHFTWLSDICQVQSEEISENSDLGGEWAKIPFPFILGIQNISFDAEMEDCEILRPTIKHNGITGTSNKIKKDNSCLNKIYCHGKHLQNDETLNVTKEIEI